MSARRQQNDENSVSVDALQRRIRELEEESQDKDDMLRQSQRNAQAEQEGRTRAERQLADATNRPSTGSQRANKRRRPVVDSPPGSGDEATPPIPKQPRVDEYSPNADDEKSVADLGRKFAILYGMWFPGTGKKSNVDEVLLLPYDSDFNVSTRFTTDANKAQGQLHDVYELCQDEDLFRYRKDKWFRDSFNYGVRQQVSDTTSRLRAHCWEIFGSEFADHLRNPQERFEHFAHRIGYKPTASGPSYSRIDCPFLHSTECDEFDLDDSYTHDHLWLIFVAITRGPEAARQARLSDGETKFSPQNTTKGDSLKITRTTAGAIAACVTFAKYTFSSDEELRPKGKTTNIEYRAEFDEHLAHLLELRRVEYPPLMKVFADWDYKVFGVKDAHDHTRPVTSKDRLEEERLRVRAQVRAKLNALRRQRNQNGDQDSDQENDQEAGKDAGLGDEERRELEADPEAQGDE